MQETFNERSKNICAIKIFSILKSLSKYVFISRMLIFHVPFKLSQCRMRILVFLSYALFSVSSSSYSVENKTEIDQR